MPGVVGMFGRLDAARFEKAVAKLLALPGAFAQVHTVEGVALASACRALRPGAAAFSFARRGQVAVLVHGALFSDSLRPRRLEAADLLEVAKQGRLVEALADRDGSYTVVALDLDAHRATILTDRFGAQNVYYAQREGCLGFGPEVKAVLTMTGLTPRLAREGVLDFLACGYGLGSQTLFEGVKLLAPGMVLECDLRTGQASTRRYWALSFAREPRFERREEAEEALFEAILHSHRLLLADEPPRHQLLLSGGMDSRGMLGALVRVGKPPHRAVTWGLAQDIPYSDAAIAGQLAQRFQIPFHFLAYDTAAFVENAEEWVFRSELANDNMGWFSEGLGSLRRLHDHGAPATFVGDEFWGPGAASSDEAQARFDASMPPRFPAAIADVLRPEVSAEASARYEESIAAIMAPCTSSEPIDRRDFLYAHGRAARFLSSLGYFKEHATELRRPFLTRACLAVVTRLPCRFRINKNLYCSTMTRFMPEVMAVPDNIASSLPDWAYDVRRDPRLVHLFQDLLRFEELERGPLADLVDRGALEATRDRFFGAAVEPLERRVGHLALLWRSMYVRSRALQRAQAIRHLFPRGAVSDRASDFDALRRIALLGILQRRLGDLARA
jgi:hypothetical protein